ncbi:MAG: hydantoinase/oxoprolinase family protein [Chloroflexi bacterium]|nr:hydantoinase/oxoprolinase family protein [Chloroflexota bacterium]
MPRFGIGIDTGGTYTDAVLVDLETQAVVAHSKALTTRHNLFLGIDRALSGVLSGDPSTVQLVSLSTTLATNALVEGQGAPVCLLLLGYGGVARASEQLALDLGTDACAMIRGGHDIDGQEQDPLDLESARSAIRRYAPSVRAFAVSGYFGTRNPDHEEIVRALVHDMTGVPATTGHELTQELDAIRRAMTAALNARLIPLIGDLIGAVELALSGRGIAAPLMIVKGDGSLMLSSVARDRPIETVLSGPAASVVGARHLARTTNGVIADMGGTTTDIAFIQNGQPRLSRQGTYVGPWHTMVEAIDIHTVGLGGDSLIDLEADGSLRIGPRRVLPLCALAEQYPGVEGELSRALARADSGAKDVEFLIIGRPHDDLPLPDAVARLLQRLQAGPVSRRKADELLRYPALHRPMLDTLERQGILVRSSLTPTDAAHVAELHREWPVEPALLGFGIRARELGTTPGDLALRVLEATSVRLAQEIARKAWDDDSNGDRRSTALSSAVLERLINPIRPSRLRFVPQLATSVIGLGAPARAYFPRASSILAAELELPELGPVANAIGAIVGSVVARSRAEIVPDAGDRGFLVRSASGVTAWPTLEDARAYARARVEEEAIANAHSAGSVTPTVTVSETEQSAPVGHGYRGEVLVSSSLTAEAIGRPRLAMEKA